MFKNITKLQKSKFLFVGLLLLLLSVPAAAQEVVAGDSTQISADAQFTRYVLYSFLGVLILVFLFFLNTVRSLLEAVIETQLAQAKNQSPEATAKFLEIVNRPSVWKKLLQKLTAAKPIEKEHDILLDHDYDGIKELDNHLPPWWKWGFYLSIVVSIFYVINYHIKPIWGEGKSQLAEYDAENAKAEIAIAEYRKKAVDQVDESSVVQLTDAPSLGKGKATFTQLCVACHGDVGQGGIGPNLTDQFWLHGGDIKSVFTTIKYGVADKGMIAWKDEIKPVEMQAVASYILSLGGSNPAGAKEPQGELYIPAADSLKKDSTNNKLQIENSTAKL